MHFQMVKRNISHIWWAVALWLMFLLSFQASGQFFNQPVSWRGSVEKAGENLYDLTFVATMGPEWHIYDMARLLKWRWVSALLRW